MLNIFTGTSVNYQFFQSTVTNGNYDVTSGTLTVIDVDGNPEGHVNVVDKSITGTLKANGGTQFALTYQV